MYEPELFVETIDYNRYGHDSIYTLKLGNRLYEGTNHLGNVLVTFSNKRLGYCEDDTIYRYGADIRTANDYAAFGAPIDDRQWYSTTDSGVYRFGFNGQEKDDEVSGVGNSMTAEFWQYDARLGRRWNTDPLVKEWESPYAILADAPIYYIDPDGANANPIYDAETGEFLGTDDAGLKGEAIIMRKEDFIQGMSHTEASVKGTFRSKLPLVYSPEFLKKIDDHHKELPSRPDYDGFVTIEEGIEWAKKRPNTLKNNDPNDALYLDASKLNLGSLSVKNSGLKEGEAKNVNLFDYVYWTSWTSRATTYALGNTKIELVDAEKGMVRFFEDIYDWDYHNYPLGAQFNLEPPESMRDRLILLERVRSDVGDSHGFRVFIYGTAVIRTN